MRVGIVLKGVGGLYTVLCGGETVACRPRGRFRADGVKPLPGDRVEVNAEEKRMERILPRRNVSIRPAVANIDCLALVVSQAPPRSDPAMADRLTVAAEYRGIEVIIAVNKVDMDDGAFWRRRFETAGYAVYGVSAVTGEGIDRLRAALADRQTALAGHSGVGKTSLINALQPAHALDVGAISARTGRGRHTTRHVELITLPGGGLVADTPGFSVFAADCVSAADTAACFPEFRPYLGRCRYRDCRHIVDDGCAILQALADGIIDVGRHDSYKALRSENGA